MFAFICCSLYLCASLFPTASNSTKRGQATPRCGRTFTAHAMAIHAKSCTEDGGELKKREIGLICLRLAPKMLFSFYSPLSSNQKGLTRRSPSCYFPHFRPGCGFQGQPKGKPQLWGPLRQDSPTGMCPLLRVPSLGLFYVFGEKPA